MDNFLVSLVKKKGVVLFVGRIVIKDGYVVEDITAVAKTKQYEKERRGLKRSEREERDTEKRSKRGEKGGFDKKKRVEKSELNDAREERREG